MASPSAAIKNQATKLFKDGHHNQALELYKQATVISPEAVLYSNQALCYLKLGNWTAAVENCNQAIKLEPITVKAHFLKGRALTELGKFDSAMVSLKTAYSLAKEQRRNFGDDISSAIRLAKRKRWSALEERKLQQQSKMEAVVLNLLREQRKKMEEDICVQTERSFVECDNESIVDDVRTVFSTAREKHIRDVPDFLCGKISFEIMTDPVITPSGITYNRPDIEDHIQRVGHFDPITRQTLTCEQLTPNLAIKEVIDAFLAKNEWVEDY